MTTNQKVAWLRRRTAALGDLSFIYDREAGAWKMHVGEKGMGGDLQDDFEEAINCFYEAYKPGGWAEEILQEMEKEPC